MNSSMQVFNSILQSLSILLPCHSVHSRCSVPLQRVETVLEQCLIDMVQQGGEPHSLALKRMSFFAASRTPSSPRDPDCSVSGPARVGLSSVLLDQPPSLRPLRRSLWIFVRSVHRYYAVVRAQRAPTASVPEGLIAHRVLLPAHRFSGGGSCQGLPVPAQEFPSMPGVSDLAGSCCLALSTAALLPSVLLDHVGSLNSASFRGSIPVSYTHLR